MSNDNRAVLGAISNITTRINALNQRNKTYNEEVKKKIDGFRSPIENAIKYISKIKNEIEDLRTNITDNLNDGSKEAIQRANEQLALFEKEIEKPSELDKSIEDLGAAVQGLKIVARDNGPNTGLNAVGGRRKRRSNKKTRRKKRHGRRSNKIKYN